MQKEIMKLVRNRRIVSRRMKWLLEELRGAHMEIPRKREAQWEMVWPLLKRLRGRDLREQKLSLSFERDERTEPGWAC